MHVLHASSVDGPSAERALLYVPLIVITDEYYHGPLQQIDKVVKEHTAIIAKLLKWMENFKVRTHISYYSGYVGAYLPTLMHSAEFHI